MRLRGRVFWLAAIFVLPLGSDAFACGDKFLVAGRGTRYQRPKNSRAASVLIYANPASGLPNAVGKLPLEQVLRREGHRSTTVQSLDQLVALLAGGRFDVVLAATSVLDAVMGSVGGAPDAPAVVAFCAQAGGQEGAGKNAVCVKTPPKEASLLQAIDRAVAQRDSSLRRARRSG